MSRNSCLYIPDNLFGDLLNITGNRDVTKNIWALTQSETAKKIFGFKDDMSAIDVLNKLNSNGKLSDYLSNESFSRFVTLSEKLDDKRFNSFNDALNKQTSLRSEYSKLIPLLDSEGKKFKVNVVPEDKSSQHEFARQMSLQSLNQKLIDYIEKLGFTVKEVEGLETPGVFSPLDAETNADGLKEVIKIAKGKSGQRVMPEEISHLLVEGFQNNPFMQRLMNQMNNDIVRDILGGQYDQYYDEYSGNETKLKKEAIGRLVAQNIVDRSGINEDIKFISSKMLDKMRDNLKNGYESDIDDFISEMNDNIKWFVDTTFGDIDSIEFFDSKAIEESSIQLNHLDIQAKDLQKLAEDAYNITAKRMKILSLRNKDQKLTKDQLREFNKMKNLMEQQDYYNSCTHFVKYALEDCKKLYDQLKDLREEYKNGKINGYMSLKKAANLIVTADGFIQAYKQPMQAMSAIDSIDEIRQQLPQSNINELQELASQITGLIANIENISTDMRKNTLFKILQKYWGKDKVVKLANGTEKTITLQDIIESNIGEMSSISRWFNGLADASDPLLKLVDQMYKEFTNDRDQKIFALQQELSKLQQDYTAKTGSRDMKFMFVQDENGKFTGMLKSDRDFLAFHREKAAYRQQLKDKGMSFDQIKVELKYWDMQHTEPVNVAPDGSQRRVEYMPKQSMYPSRDLDNLTKDQREFYDSMIEIKKNLDMLLPSKYTHLYRPPMKKASVRDQALSGGSVKGVLNRVKSRFITDVEDVKSGKSNDQSTEYGESVQIDQYKDGKHVVLDFSGKEIKKIPVFYTRWLDDMSALDTNLVDTMLAYGAMALNYNIMNKLADFMELANSQMNDRKIIVTSGMRKLYERFKVGDTAFQNDYTIPGSQSEQAKALRSYTDKNVYGLKKNKESIIIGNKEVNYGSIGDALKSYNSVVSLGLNIFSGTTNLTMGIAQTLIQCSGNQHFGLKNIVKANKEYFKNLPNGIMGQYADEKHDKLNLLIQKFDCLEEYYNQLDDNNYYGGVFKKMVGKWNPLIFNSMGEHYLHSISMLAILDKNKVRVPQTDKDGNPVKDSEGKIAYGELISLYDALKVTESEIEGFDGKNKKVYKIDYPQFMLKEDGSLFTQDDFLKIKLMIQDVNHKMHGAFNDVDRGDINKWVLGRMLMQFRQWMPAFYNTRFKAESLDPLTGEMNEGFYRTYFQFIYGLLQDAFRLKFNLMTRFHNLTDTQKANVRMAFTESSLALLLLFLTHRKFMAPDKDDPAVVNILKYNLYRLKMELGAAAPTSLDFLDNIKTLVQSPIPATENLDRLISFIDITLIGSTVKSGRYEGWNKYLRNIYFATPTARNIGRVVDLMDGDISMFNPYRKVS